MSDVIARNPLLPPSLFGVNPGVPGVGDGTKGVDDFNGATGEAEGPTRTRTANPADITPTGFVLGPIPSAYPTTPSDNGDAPPLPDVTGPTMPMRQALGTPAFNVGWLDMPSKASLAQAVAILSDIQWEQLLMYGKMRAMAGENQVSMQLQSVHALQDQISAERGQAWFKLGVSFVAAVSAGTAGFLGSKLSSLPNATSKQQAGGQLMMSLSQTLGPMINAFGDAIDKQSGFGRQADDAKIRKAIADMYVSLYKAQEDTWNSGYDTYRNNMNNLYNNFMRQTFDSQNQVNMTVAGNL